MVFPVVMYGCWELDCEERWAPKNWCFWTVVLEKTLECLLDCKEFQPVHSERDQPWDFFGRNDAIADTPVLWPPHAKSWLIGKVSDAGRDWGQEEKGTTEDEMAGWHHWLNGRESEWTPEVGDGQRGLVCCNSWGLIESDATEWLNWTEYYSVKKEKRKTYEHSTIKHIYCQVKKKSIWKDYKMASCMISVYNFLEEIAKYVVARNFGVKAGRMNRLSSGEF